MTATDAARQLAPVVIALGVIGGGVSVSAQQVSAQQGRGVGDLSEIVEVTVVEVDVVARDRSRQPVNDLEAEDFRVFDNGQRVDVAYFSRGEGAGGGLAERLSIVVFLDNLHLSSKARDAVLPEVKRFLEGQMVSGDVHAMVVSFDGQLRMLQDLTPDYGEVAIGINRVEAGDEVLSQAKNLKRRSQESFGWLLEQLEGLPRETAQGIGSFESTLAELRGHGKVLFEDAATTADALGSMVESLALLPGRKAFLYVSDGLALRPFDQLATNLQRRMLGTRDPGSEDLMRLGGREGAGGFDGSSNIMTGDSNAAEFAKLRTLGFHEALADLDSVPRFRQLVAQANSHRVTFFTFKPPEVEAAAATLGERVSDAGSLSHLTDLRQALLLLAEGTGGRAMVSGEDVPAFFELVAGDLGAYYSLGYQLDGYERDSLHEIEVKVKRRGVRLRHRTSYVAQSLRSRLADRTLGALLLGWTENPLELRLDRIDQQTAIGGLYDVVATVSMPLAKLSLVETGDIMAGRVRMVAAVRTENGEQLEPNHIAVPLAIPADHWEEAKGQFFAVNFELSLPRGTHRVAFGLWDENAGQTSFIRREIAVR